jgi:hypothetical protein
MDNFILWIGSVVGISDWGGDKALVRRKAEAKARRYAPFFKNVDESPSCAAPCLTVLRETGRWCGRACGPQKNRVKI